MRSVALVMLGCALTTGIAYSQDQPAAGGAMDAALAESMKKDKEKSDKDIADEKAASKAATWMNRAKTYQNIALQSIKLDSNAAMVSYDAYKKVIELDKDKKGGPGRQAKEAEEALKSRDFYNALMQQGVARFQSKNYKEAVKTMSMASTVLPSDTLAPLYTAIGAQQIQDNKTAEEQLEKYIANGGKDASIYGSLAMLYRNDKEVDKALAALDKGLALDPANKDLSNERINLMLSSNRMDDAIAGMKKMVEKDPNNVQNLVNLSIIYNNSAGKLSDEIRQLSEQTKKSGGSGKALADAKGLLETYNGEVKRLTAKKPKTPDVTRQLADVKKKATEQATTVAKLEADAKAAAANPSASAGAEAKLAELKKQYDEQKGMEKDYLQKAIAVDGNNYDANYNMGVYYFNDAVEMKRSVDNMDMAEYNKRGKEIDGQVCGKFKLALPYFTKAKSIKADDAELNGNLENLQNVLKQYEERKIVCVEAAK
ncbi:tetratricopeptide repeat protein [Spirosoma pomorum]